MYNFHDIENLYVWVKLDGNKANTQSTVKAVKAQQNSCKEIVFVAENESLYNSRFKRHSHLRVCTCCIEPAERIAHL